jgi:hypothetical protein
MRSRRRWPAFALALLWPVGLWAQEAAPPPPADIVGARVRLRSTALRGKLKGLVVASDDQSVTLRLESGKQVSLSKESIVRLEQSQGCQTPNAMTAAWIALGVGLGTVVAPEHVDPKDCGVWSDHFCSRAQAIAGGIFVSGLFLGLAEPPAFERWRQVAIPRTGSGFVVTRREGGIGVRVGFRF